MAHHGTGRRRRSARLGRIVGLIAMLPFIVAARPAFGADDNAQPLQCWWRTTVSAIRVGEPFGLILTCAALETESLTAVVERGRLDPKAIELPPFEVLGGATAPDLRDGTRVFFQNQYTLRFVNDAFFNQDVPLPALSVVYRIQTRVNTQPTESQGMEQRFAMPHGSIRISSLVPADAVDIRDTSAATFADVDALASRGRLLTAGGMSLTALGALVLLVGMARTFVGRTAAPSAGSDLAGDTAILRGVVRELSAVKSDRDESGWNAGLVSRALACSRIVAEIATSGKVNRHLASQAAPVAGGLAVKPRWPSSQTLLVSASMTPKTLGRALAQTGARDRTTSIDLEAMHGALTELTQVAYSDEEALPAESLDGALSTVQRLARRLRLVEAWPVRQFVPLIRRVGRLKAPR